jgi:hypothetical protein
VDALLVKFFFGEAKPGSTEAPSMGTKIRFLYQVTDGPNAVGHAPELERTRMKTGVGKGEGGRQEDGKYPLKLRSRKILSQRVSERNHRGAGGGKVTKRKRVATTLDDKDNVDQRKENLYENRAFTCPVVCRKRCDCRACGGSEPRKEGLTVRILSV